MALLSDYIGMDLAVGLLSLILLIVLFFNRHYKYWKNRGVPYVKPLPVVGNLLDNVLGKRNIFQIHEEVYNKLKGERFGGYFEFHAPNLMIMDPDLIYRVLVKDFAYFHDRSMFPNDPENDPLSNTISTLTGQDWRVLRHKLTPTFTSGKLKGMLDQIYNSGEHLLGEIDKLEKNKRDFDARELLSEFAIDVIASCAFGLQFKLDSPDGQKFKRMILNSFPQTRLTSLVMLMRAMYTRFSNILGLRTFSKEVTDYFVNLSKETVSYRRKQGAKRNDFLQLLIDLKEKEENKNAIQESEDVEDDEIVNQLKYSSVYSKDFENKKVMTDECMAATSFLFLTAGTEVSSVLVYTLFHLARNPEIQEKLQQEIDQVLSKHKTFNYHAVKDMVYLDKVLNETMRINPISPFLNRVCTIPYRIPGSDVLIEEGTRITIPVWAIHRDPRHYPDPEVFNPERFPEPNYKPTHTYMPFGDGPRICIAMRFAILEMKVCMARIMSQYTIALSNKTKLPIQYEPKGFFPRIQGGVWLFASKRK